jgi:hypothetical protein
MADLTDDTDTDKTIKMRSSSTELLCPSISKQVYTELEL